MVKAIEMALERVTGLREERAPFGLKVSAASDTTSCRYSSQSSRLPFLRRYLGSLNYSAWDTPVIRQRPVTLYDKRKEEVGIVTG